MSKTLSAPATLKEFRWGAPHSSVVFVIKGPDGKPQELSMVSASPAAFAKQGFAPPRYGRHHGVPDRRRSSSTP